MQHCCWKEVWKFGLGKRLLFCHHEWLTPPRGWLHVLLPKSGFGWDGNDKIRVTKFRNEDDISFKSKGLNPSSQNLRKAQKAALRTTSGWSPQKEMKVMQFSRATALAEISGNPTKPRHHRIFLYLSIWQHSLWGSDPSFFPSESDRPRKSPFASFWMAEISPCSSGKLRKSRGRVSSQTKRPGQWSTCKK